MTGFEPATTRPPDVYSTGLSYISIDGANINISFIATKQKWEKYFPDIFQIFDSPITVLSANGMISIK